MITGFWYLFLGCGAVCVFAILVAAVNRWPVVGGIGMAASVLTAWEVPQPPPLLNVGNNNIYGPDVLALAFLLIGIIHFRRCTHQFPLEVAALSIMGVLLISNFVRGTAINGLGSATNDFRSFFYPLTAWFWSLTFRQRPRAESPFFGARVALLLGWALTIVGMYHLARYGLGSVSGFVDPATGISQTSRILVAGQAITLVLCIVVVLFAIVRRRNKFHAFSAIVFSLVVVFSLERSAWVAGMAAAFVAFLLSPARKKTVTIVGVGAVAMFVVFAVLVWRDSIGSLLNDFSNAATSIGTYDGRTNSWTSLFSASLDRGPLDVVFGQPLGGGYGRYEGAGRWVDYAPHNWYLTVYLRMGLFGLLALIAMLVSAVVRIVRRPVSIASAAVLTAVVVYGWTYSWSWYLMPFLGWAYVASWKNTVRRARSRFGVSSHIEASLVHPSVGSDTA